MRKNSVRKFVHMAIDILPLLIIPIFALNILHKETEPISIEVQEKVSVDFNQLRKDTLTNTNVGVTTTIINGALSFSGTSSLSSTYSYIVSDKYTIMNHYYLYRLSNYSIAPRLYAYSFANRGTGGVVANKQFVLGSDDYYYARFQSTQDNASIEIGNNVTNGTSYESTYYLDIFDITQMGMEDLSNEEISIYYSQQSYLYTESEKMLVNKPSPTTYNDTDIGSQFLYSLYKPVQDYFNFNNLFNMGQIYDWIQLNLFIGTAPLPIFIIWNIIVYEFFVDLIFLLYSVFMFVIDFATCMIDSFMGKARKGV